MKTTRLPTSCLVLFGLVLSMAGLRAQWRTESFELKAGWNAVFLHVDASHATLDELVAADFGNPIQEVWLWNPLASASQFVESPLEPAGTGTPWSSWVRPGSPSSALQRLIGPAAYLVRIDASVPSYTWNLKGKVVPPRYEWTTSGLNFLGFPLPSGSPRTFEDFLAPAPELQQQGEIFRYVGGPLGPGNPERVLALRTTLVTRGEAYWIRAGGAYNRYFGPIDLTLQNPAGVDFGDSIGQSRIRLRNAASTPVTVTLQLLPSEAPPAGQPAVADVPPLLVRGPLNTTDLTYGFSNLVAGAQTFTLAAREQSGSEVEVVLGLNRSLMTADPGSLYAGILRLTDSLGLAQVELPVSALANSTTGLWIGEAAVTQVQHYLKSYEKDPAGSLVLVNGKYVATGTNVSLGSVPRPFPLRLIVHHGTNGEKALLQRVYYGQRFDTNIVVATRESLLDPAHLKNARRISATHLPFAKENLPWSLAGEMRAGTNLTALIGLDYDDQGSNPFVHTYHPDHDNLNATFDQKLPQGGESASLTREIRLSFTPPADDFQSLTAGALALTGDYDETLTIGGSAGESRQFQTRGRFTLHRISTIPTLTQ